MRMRTVRVVMALVGLLIVAALLFWFNRPVPVQYAPLAIVRQPLGKLPPAPVEPGSVQGAFLSDMDGDGDPEAIALYVDWRRSGEPHSAVWHNLQGAVQTLPLFMLSPSAPHAGGANPVHHFRAGNPPLPRELIGWDTTTGHIAILFRQGGGWQTKTVDALKGEALRNAVWTDTDGDERIDDAIVLTQTGRYAWFELDAQGRWQLRSVGTTPPKGHAKPMFMRRPRLAGALPSSPIDYMVATTTYIPQFSIPDIDGDGKPERFATNGKTFLQTSRRNRVLPLPNPHATHPFSNAYVAELDGQPGAEIVYPVHVPASKKLQLQVYHFENKTLKPIAQWDVPVDTDTAVWLKDLNQDGRAEIILADPRDFPRARLNWHVLRYENRQLVEQQFEKSLSAPLEPSIFPAVELPNGVAFSTYSRPHWLPQLLGTTQRTQYTLLIGFPQPPESADPSRWQMMMLDEKRLVWAGDYDGDGTGEVVLDAYPAGEGVWLMQFRDNRWYGARVAEQAHLAAVLPAHLQGQPRLILIYADGTIEAVAIRQ